jgi:hypothetical protein
MTEYKKSAPENTSGSMTHSKGAGREPDIEWYLAEISNIIQREFVHNQDIEEGITEELFDLIRKVWDLVPQESVCAHCFEHTDLKKIFMHKGYCCKCGYNPHQ